MGASLSNGQTRAYMGYESWERLLDLATRYGWEPAGTEAPDLPDDVVLSEDWSGGYMTSDHQIVTPADARNLADALERALPDIPRHDCDRPGGRLWVPRPDGTLKTKERPLNHFEWFSGAHRAAVEQVIALCREGGFSIG